MAFVNLFCYFVLFLLVSVTHVQMQNAECSVDNKVVEIKENNNPGLVVTHISAKAGVIVTIKPSADAAWFEIKDSQLVLKEKVDFESIQGLEVELICWRGHSEVQTLFILILITNENDNPPVFKETNITIDVPEDTKVNTVVVPLANVTATDADFDVLFYNLEGSPPEAMNYFKIQGINNPQIYLLKELDYEAINLMEFTLSAMDGNANASGTNTATATITIRIIETDLKPPWFQPCVAIGDRIVCISLGYTSKVNISEYVRGPLILEPGPLYAIDGDKSLNEKIVYEIAAGNDNDTFLVDRYSGNITMNKSANTLKTFMLYIVGSQYNNPYRYSQTTVKIDVVHKNDNQPYFEENIYMGRMYVNQPAKTLIMKANNSLEPLQIFAADHDFFPDKINPDIKYRIQNSSDFRVTMEGFIQTTAVLNLTSHIMLLAIATDTNTLEEASTLISIDVTPLATPAVPPVTTTAFTETSTETSHTIPGNGTTSSKPSDLPPSISSGSTKSMSSPSSTIGNSDLTKVTGNPVTVTVTGSVIPPFVTTIKLPDITGNSSPFLTTDSPVTGISQQTAGSDKTTTQAPLQPGTTKPSITGTTISGGTVYSPTSQIAITKSPTTSASLPEDDGTLSTTSTPQARTTKPTIRNTTSGGTVHSLTSSQATITKSPTAGTNLPVDDGRQSTTSTHQPVTTKPSTTGTSITINRTNRSTSLLFTTAISTPSTANSTATSLTSKSTISTTVTSSKMPSANESSTTSPEGPYSIEDMAALGATLGSLLAIALALLALMSYKYYKLKKELEKGSPKITEDISNANFQDDEQLHSSGNDDQSPASIISKSYAEETQPESNEAQEADETIQEEEIEDIDSEKEVRSILTKDRKMEDDGYKAVWFREDIVPEAKGGVMNEDDSGLEENNAADEDDYNQATDSSRGDSDVNVSSRRVQLLDITPSATQSLEETEGKGGAL